MPRSSPPVIACLRRRLIGGWALDADILSAYHGPDPQTVRSAHRPSLAAAKGDRRGKSGPRRLLTMSPSPWAIRTTARNRVGNQPIRATVAAEAATAHPGLWTRFRDFADRAAHRSRASRLAR